MARLCSCTESGGGQNVPLQIDPVRGGIIKLIFGMQDHFRISQEMHFYCEIQMQNLKIFTGGAKGITECAMSYSGCLL